MRKVSQKGKIILAVIERVLDWFCHSNEPAPNWWRTTGPYKTILEVVESEQGIDTN